jgi:tetratricopeptide (TPR) repeat protein
MSANAPPSEASWFEEHDLLLGELRASSERRGPLPSVPGYAFVSELARGGQGAVYLARQESTRRPVAIKVLLHQSFASPTARRRFEREVELVASLDHPGIVRVFDGGVTADGAPYLVMEHVDGVPLDRHVEVAGRDPRVTASLLATVLDALHAAHVRGVIHRDIKPRNVLVDREGRPRLVDFGLARETARPAGDRSELSVRGQFLGSLPWASPEQASGDPGLADVRSDVYSAGVMLFHALTGAFPYPVDGSLAETLHAITTRDAARPSAVRRDLPRELDAILQMALAKAPADRYQSAAAFAADLRAFLAGGPMQARSDGALVIARKTLRRYRLVAMVSAGFSVALLLTTAFAVRQTLVAKERRAQAETRFGQVRSIANDFLFTLHEDLVRLPGSRTARERVVTTALKYLRELEPDADDDAAFTAELASAWERVGDIQGSPLTPNLGQTAEAIASYREALTFRRRLAAAAPQDAQRQAEVGITLNLIGYAQAYLSDPMAAIATLEEAVPWFRSARAADPLGDTGIVDWVSNRDRIADVHSLVGHHAEAIAALREAQSIMATSRGPVTEPARVAANRAVPPGKIAFALMALGRPEEALVESQRSIEAIRDATRLAPDDARHRRSLNAALNDLGWILTELGRLDEAAAALHESIETIRALERVDPTDPLTRQDVSYTLIKVGELAARRGIANEAIDALREAQRIRTELRQASPTDGAAWRREMVVQATLGSAALSLAERAPLGSAERVKLLDQSRTAFVEGIRLLESMRAERLLLDSDGGAIDELRAELARVDATQR